MRDLSLRLTVRGAVLAVALVGALWVAPALLGCLRAAAAEEGAYATGEPASFAEPARGPETNLPLPRFVSMKASSANARRGPSQSYRIDWEFVRRGMPLQVTAEYGHWRRVQDAEGQGGWVHHSLLTGGRTVLMRGEDMVPLRTEPSEGGRLLAWAEPGAIARLDRCEGAWCRISAEPPDACEGLWCRISTGRIDGWVAKAVLWGVE
jgi:SH3-like domain-containing protein